MARKTPSVHWISKYKPHPGRFVRKENETKEKERISYEVCWPFAGGEHSWNKWEEMKKRKREWGWERKIANRKKWKIIMTSSNEKLGSAGDWCFTTWVLVSCEYSRISSLLAVTDVCNDKMQSFFPLWWIFPVIKFQGLRSICRTAWGRIYILLNSLNELN